jgi:ATP-dependent DNA helicase RecG
MNERIVTPKEIIDLANRDESHFYDNKAFQIKGDKIQKIAVAFANADGGEFIVGIKDKKEETDTIRRWQGIDDMESFNFVFQNLNELLPTIPHRFEFLKDENGKYALRITIEKSESVHKTANNCVYVRKSGQSLLFERSYSNSSIILCKRRVIL